MTSSIDYGLALLVLAVSCAWAALCIARAARGEEKEESTTKEQV